MAKKSLPMKRPASPGEGKLAGERIREAARDLFYRQGIRAVGVDEIVAHAGVTKPSLYRSFASKDELATACLRDRSDDYLRRFDAAMMEYPDDPHAGFRAWLEQLSQRATKPDYRGCALTNAAVEYPERKHPARLVAAANKREFRAKLNEAATAMGAREPALLADGLLLLIEGAYASGQLFGADGPARVLVETADALIDRCCARNASRSPDTGLRIRVR
jgi:AcrR family transcriptional regulator